jgi:hypothetical protein
MQMAQNGPFNFAVDLFQPLFYTRNSEVSAMTTCQKLKLIDFYELVSVKVPIVGDMRAAILLS